jgi:hypothetical protein
MAVQVCRACQGVARRGEAGLGMVWQGEGKTTPPRAQGGVGFETPVIRSITACRFPRGERGLKHCNANKKENTRRKSG